jgi:hypothetical protein
MKKIIGLATGGALFFVVLALSACGAIPTADDVARAGSREIAGRPGNDGTEAQSVADNSGLGTIAYDGRTVTKCKRRRSTGSNMRRSSCSNVDSGSQPVRVGTYTDPVPVITPGMNRPQ